MHSYEYSIEDVKNPIVFSRLLRGMVAKRFMVNFLHKIFRHWEELLLIFVIHPGSKTASPNSAMFRRRKVFMRLYEPLSRACSLMAKC